MHKIQTLLMLGILCLLSFRAGAEEFPTITLCNQCSAEWEYGKAALLSSDLSPGQSEDIYVINIFTSQMRPYRVGLTIVGPDSGDQTSDLEVTAINGDPVVLDDIAAAIDILKNPRDEKSRGIPAEELGLPHGLDSAIDLIGPDHGNADFYRSELEHALAENYKNFLPPKVAGSKTLEQLRNQFLARISANTDVGQSIYVRFNDGSRVRLEMESLEGDSSDTTEVTSTFHTDIDSVTAPGINYIPHSLGQFSRFIASELDNELSKQVRELILRFGLDIIGPADSEACTTSFTCEANTCTTALSC